MSSSSAHVRVFFLFAFAHTDQDETGLYRAKTFQHVVAPLVRGTRSSVGFRLLLSEIQFSNLLDNQRENVRERRVIVRRIRREEAKEFYVAASQKKSNVRVSVFEESFVQKKTRDLVQRLRKLSRISATVVLFVLFLRDRFEILVQACWVPWRSYVPP